MLTINTVNKNNKFNPIIHKCDPERIGEPMADDELHTFAIEVVLVFYHYQYGYIKSKNTNPGIEYPHIVMENKDTNRLYYVIVKAGIHPHIPKPSPIENYSTLIKLAEEANAYPVFIVVVSSKYSKGDYRSFKCGDEYLVKITRLKEL